MGLEMALIPQGLADGWEVALLAATYPNKRVQGITRANKVLSRLQREGVPITFRFRNIQMGPASLDLMQAAKTAQQKGILEINEIDQQAEGLENRTDFVLTKEGLDYVTGVVLPELNKQPRGDVIKRAFSRALRESKFAKTNALIDESHATLMLDDPVKLLGAHESAFQQLSAQLDALREGPRPRDSMTILVGATVEFATDALAAIEPMLRDPSNKWTGKNHILAKSVELVDLAEEWGRLRALPKMGKTLEEEFELALNALEVNAEIYGILELPNEQDIDELLAEVAPLDPVKGHE